MTALRVGICPCTCDLRASATPRLIALTGGPGAGKTAVLEMASRALCRHVAILPEAASLVFGGGFPRHDTRAGREAAQRAIYHIQRQLEALVTNENEVRVALCDRGTVDSLAYWPGDDDVFWSQVHSSLPEELARYEAVIHLQTPNAEGGYNHQNPLRVETPEAAAALDARIQQVWAEHPNRVIIPSSTSFMDKAARALGELGKLL